MSNSKWVKNQMKKHDADSDKKQLDSIIQKRQNMLKSMVEFALD